MSEHHIELRASFSIQPVQLLAAQKRIPVNGEGFVPLGIFSEQITILEPNIRNLGNSAVCLSLGAAFGFMTYGDRGRLMKSQKTTDITLKTERSSSVWHATLNTPKSLSNNDVLLFNKGIWFYVVSAIDKLARLK